jgi:hypothetical protein
LKAGVPHSGNRLERNRPSDNKKIANLFRGLSLKIEDAEASDHFVEAKGSGHRRLGSRKAALALA